MVKQQHYTNIQNLENLEDKIKLLEQKLLKLESLLEEK